MDSGQSKTNRLFHGGFWMLRVRKQAGKKVMRLRKENIKTNFCDEYKDLLNCVIVSLILTVLTPHGNTRVDIQLVWCSKGL